MVSLGATASRGLLDAPPFPVLSSATVTITGNGMSPISASLVNGAATIEVPEGDGRLVTVDAVPDWAATAAANPSSVLPKAALRYGGTATVNVQSGRTTQAKVHLSMTASKIVLPSVSNYRLYLADSFSDVASVTDYVPFVPGPESDFEPDQFGRVYMTIMDAVTANFPGFVVFRNDGGDLATSPIGIVDHPAKPISRIAPDGVNGRLYCAGDDGSTQGELGYYDAARNVYANFNGESISGNWEPYNSGTNLYPRIAVDTSGGVYVLVYNVDEGVNYVAKLTVGAPYYSAVKGENVADLTILSKTSYAAAGLTYTSPSSGNLRVDDMIVVGDTLYLLGNDYLPPSQSRGKIVALRTSDLGNPRSAGWSGDANSIPTDPSSQFYGPVRFIGLAPGKLYVADEGYNGSPVDRVVEVSLDPLAIGGVSPVPVDVTFFSY